MLRIMLNAFRGRMRWMKIKRKYSIDNSGIYVLMFPDSDRDFNTAALANIDEFLNYRKGNGVIILTTDEWVAQNAKEFSDRITAVEQITQQDFFYYHSYYYYYGFSEQFIMVSLDGEHGKRLALVENVRGITKEDMACMGLYIIRSWNKTGTRDYGQQIKS